MGMFGWNPPLEFLFKIGSTNGYQYCTYIPYRHIVPYVETGTGLVPLLINNISVTIQITALQMFIIFFLQQ